LNITEVIGEIKDSLGIGPKTVIGIDIGLSGIKVAEIVKTKKGYILQSFAIENLAEGVLIEDEIQEEEQIRKSLKDALEKAGIEARFASLGLYGPNTVARKLQLAGGSEDDIADQVAWEAEQYLPFNLEESSVDFHVIGENEGGGIDVIIAAVRSDVLSSFRRLIEPTLKLKIADLSLISLVNLFEVTMKDRLDVMNESWVIIDFGAQYTQFVIYKSNMIVFTKEIPVGGSMITEEIQRQMGVNYYEAEDLKINGDENGNLPEEILGIIDNVVENFLIEISKTINFYVTSTNDETFVGCMITGGGAEVPGLVDALGAVLKVEVDILNPLDVIEVNSKRVKSEEQEIVFRGAVAIGLALRGCVE